MTPVKSSHVKAIGKDGPHLHVEFKDGAKWEYENAARHYEAMLKADSVGKYLHHHVKNVHKGRKLG